MELRDHPAMSYHSVRSWPPLWTATKNDGQRETVRGEIGVLSTAYTTSSVAKICFVVMEHQSETYIGALMLEDPSFCRDICSFLEKNIGRPIAEIGSMDLSRTL